MNDFMQNMLRNEYGITPLPSDPVVAMAYVPFQIPENVYSAEQGISVGTMFPELNKPFECKSIGGEING